jgi:hypothetical protein
MAWSTVLLEFSPDPLRAVAEAEAAELSPA